MQSRSLEYIEEKGEFSEFDVLVPGLSEVSAKRASRRLKASQVDPDDEEQVAALMAIAEDESITWGEE